MLTKRQQELKKELQNEFNKDWSTTYRFEDVKTVHKEIISFSKEDVLLMSEGERKHIRMFAKSFNDEMVAVEMNPTKEDKDFIRFIVGNSVPVFFSSKRSSSIKIEDVEKFFNRKQFADSFIMPVTLKEVHKRKTTSITVSSSNFTPGLGVLKDKGVRSYPSTIRSNINAVQALVVDIDLNHNEESVDVNKFADSFLFFAQEENLEPSGIVNTGRGIQVWFKLEVPVYRNDAKRIDSLLKLSYEALKKEIEEKVLSQISGTYSCDTALNPINQKVRLPGTYNFKSGTYAHVVFKNEKNLFNLGDFLTEVKGEYQPYVREKKKAKRKGGNNGNGKDNLRTMFMKRISDIENAILRVSEVYNEGYRNNAYVTLMWQWINLVDVLKGNATKEEAIQKVFELDQKLSKPYFKTKDSVENFYKSVENTQGSAKNYKLKNKSIEDYCIVLNLAKDLGMEFEIFFKKTVTQKRKERKELRLERKENLLRSIKKSLCEKQTIKDIAKNLNLARNTVYRYIKELVLNENKEKLEKVNIRKAKVSIIKKLKEEKSLIRHLGFKVKDLVSKKTLSLLSYILFNTEKLNTNFLDQKLSVNTC